MVTVTFFGLLRSNHQIRQFTMNAKNMRDIIKYIKTHYPNITNCELEEAVLFVNKNKTMHMKRFDIPLDDGDDVIFTTYVGGG